MRSVATRVWMVACVFAAGSRATHATVVFQNTGTTSGWSYTSHDGSGSVSQGSSPVYKGSTSLKCYQTWSGSGDYTLHSEAVKRDVGKNGWDRYYGWTMYLPTNWSYNPSRGQSVSQLAADTSCGGQQTEMFQMMGTRLEVKRELVNPCSPTRQTITVVDPVSRGAWHRIVIRKKWAADSAGSRTMYIDHARVTSSYAEADPAQW